MTSQPDIAPLHARLIVMGKMAAGKTTASDYYVRRYGATAWTVAERIKQVAHAAVGHSGDLGSLLDVVLTGGGQERLRQEATWQLLRFADSYEMEPGKPRRLYQEVGQILRDLAPESQLCWEQDLERRIESSPSTFTVVDVRSKEGHGFFVGERGYRCLVIDASLATRKRRLLARDRHDVVDDSVFSHQSETDVDSLASDWVISNESDDPSALHAGLDGVAGELRALFPQP